MQRKSDQGLVYYQFDGWNGHVTHGMFTRQGGVSESPWNSLNVGGTVGDSPAAVQENHRRMYNALGLDAERACTVWQVHSADTVLAYGRVPNRRWLARADGMITNQPGLPLTMRYADCTPLLLYDPAHHAIAIGHAGWRGTVLHMAQSLIDSMRAAFGTRPGDLLAGIGPCIGPDRYQVGPEVVEAVQQAFGTLDGLIKRADDGSAYLNMWESNRLALERAGVSQIEIAGICTATHTDEFYSHRAEAGRTGRFGVIMALAD